MIISSEHRELLDEFVKANEVEGEAIKTLNAYMSSPNADRKVTMDLFKKFEKSHEEKMMLYSKLKKLDLSQASQKA